MDIQLSGYDPWGQPNTANKKWGKFWVGGHHDYRSIFLFSGYISANNRDIDTKILDMILRVYPVHQECHG